MFDDNNAKENINVAKEENGSGNISDVLSAIRELDKKFELKILDDELKNKMFDEMHMRMLKYQDDFIAKIIEPILKSLIQLSDSIKRDLEYYKEKECEVEVIDTLFGIVEQIDAILFDHNVEPYSAGTDVVNTKEQNVVKTLATEDYEKNNCVSAILSTGYKRNGKIFRTERVEIYKHTNITEELQ